MGRRGKVLVLWNQAHDDVYERWRAEGPTRLEWDRRRKAPEVETESEEIEAIVKAIRKNGRPAAAVNVRDDFDRLVAAVRKHRPAVIFNLVEFFNDDAAQEAFVAGIYELLRVPYTGATPLCLATCQRKFRSKVLMQAAGLPTPPFFLVRVGERVPRRHGLRFPLIVKPVREDASGGIEPAAVVRNEAQLRERVAHVHEEYRQPALVERYVHGREIHVSIIGNDPPEVLPLLELEFDDKYLEPAAWGFRPRLLTYDAKWNPRARAFYAVDSVVPARRLSKLTRIEIEAIALEAYRTLECRDYARVDVRLDGRGRPFILEVNPNPDLSEGVGFMLCAEESGRDFVGTIEELVAMAAARAGVPAGVSNGLGLRPL